jgi:hypothetical protein
MYVPWYVGAGLLSSLLIKVAQKVDPARGKRFAERSHPELDPARITISPRLTLRHARARRRFPSAEAFYAWESEDTGNWISRQGFSPANALFGFVRNVSASLCARARDSGLKVVVDQMIATALEEARQERLQSERFPQFAPPGPPAAPTTAAPKLLTIERETWSAADAITCASDYVKTSLVAQGIPPDRVHVHPYPIDASHYPFVDRTSRSGPVTVGFVGLLGLRKGTPYLLAVADKLKAKNLKFSLVGNCSIDRSRLSLAPNVELVGPVPRSEIANHLARFDLFFFPSTCEGSPGAVMEAMATGLPVVTTPNSGTVVRHNTDGFIHPYDDIDALASSIDNLATDASLRHQMSQNARTRAESFNLDAYGQQLSTLFSSLLKP